MRRLVFSVALALGVFLAVAGAALAAPRVVVLRIEYEGRVAEASKVFLSERLVEGLAGAGFEVSAGDVLASATDGGAPAENCRTEDCYRKIAGRLALDYLVVAHITIREKNYDLRLQLVGGTDGRAAGSERVGCELCGIQEVGEKLDKLASSLLTAALAARRAVAPARITVQSEPAGASVTIDGRAAGETPLSVDLSPGSHDLALTASGHASAKKKITLDAGVRGLVSVGLIPLGSGGAPPPALASRNWLALGWASLALGAAAVGGGVGVFTLDGKVAKCPGPEPAPGSGLVRTPCKRNTRLAAGALIGAGGAAMAAGTFFLYMGWGSSSAPGEAVLASDFSLSIGGKF